MAASSVAGYLLHVCKCVCVCGCVCVPKKSPLPVNVDKHVTGKSKKSLEDAFTAAEKPKNTGAVEIPKSTIIPEVSSSTSSETCSTSSSATAGKQTVLHINNSAYAIMKKLGCGGSSSVYLAQRKDNGRECALKVVDLHGDPAVVEGYMNETKLLAKLQGNICVVALYD